MSVEAITWALKEQVKHSSAKFVLVVLANCSNGETFESFPSVKHISDATAQDRKTVLSNLKKLIESGHISDTGKRVGQTGQVIVYKLNSTENGVVKQSQKRNSTENGTVPNFPDNSTVFPVKESQISHVTVPKTGHGTVKEPSIEPSLTNNKKKVVDQSEIDFPYWLKNSDWDDFVEFRKSIKKPMTDLAKRLMVKNLVAIANQFSPQTAIDQMHLSIRNNWSDVYKPKPDQTNAYDRKMQTLSGLTGGIHGSSSDAEFKPLTETQIIDMEHSNANLLR